MVKIAVPTDLKDNWLSVLTYSLMLAEAQEAELNIIHVVNDEEDVQTLKHEILTETIRQLDLNGYQLEYQPQINVLVGNKKEIIVHAVNAETYDFVILDAKSGLGKIKLFGGILHYLLKHINHPILFLPEDFEMELPKELLYASDLKDGDVQRVFQFYRALSNVNPLIRIVHYSHDDDLQTDLKLLEVYKDDIQSRFPYIKMRIEADIIEKGNSLMDKIQEDERDWTALSTHSRTFKEKLLNPSLTLELMKNLKKPLFVFKDEIHFNKLQD